MSTNDMEDQKIFDERRRTPNHDREQKISDEAWRVLNLEEEQRVRILVDMGSVNNGYGAPQASLQLMKTIRDKYRFDGEFELIPMGCYDQDDAFSERRFQGAASYSEAIEYLEKQTKIQIAEQVKEKMKESESISEENFKELLRDEKFEREYTDLVEMEWQKKIKIMSKKQYEQLKSTVLGEESEQNTLLGRVESYFSYSHESDIVPKLVRFGFTGAYDRGMDPEDGSILPSGGNELYSKGMGCEFFITLSTQGWEAYKTDKGEIYGDETGERELRVNPNVYVHKSNSRKNVSIHLPRKDVLVLDERKIDEIQTAKIQNYEDKQLQVVLYKLDQDKNVLTEQRECILRALQKYASQEGFTIQVVEVRGGNLALDEKKFAELYHPLTIKLRKPNMSPTEYHTLLASSHAVFCEGQSTGSQAMLYGTASFHIPLDGQGVNIHRSNIAVNDEFPFMEDRAKEFTDTMAESCEDIRKKKHTLSERSGAFSERHNANTVEKYLDIIEIGLGQEGQGQSMEIGNSIRRNPQLDMLTQCVEEVNEHLLVRERLVDEEQELEISRLTLEYQSLLDQQRPAEPDVNEDHVDVLRFDSSIPQRNPIQNTRESADEENHERLRRLSDS